MENVLRRHPWLLDVVVLIACAVLTAHAVSLLLAAKLGHAALRGQPPPPPRAAAVLCGPKRGDAIAGRRLFGVPVARAQPVPLELLAIMVAPPADERWSLAVVRDRDARVAGPVAVGSRVRGATVVEIGETTVALALAGGGRQVLDLLDRPPVARSADDGITRVGEHAYEVRRSTVEAYLRDVGTLAARTRVAPELRDGRVVGVRLLAIRPTSPLGRIGLASGDVVLAVGGVELSSPAAAVEAYSRLGTGDRIAVDVERVGKRITLEYMVR